MQIIAPPPKARVIHAALRPPDPISGMPDIPLNRYGAEGFADILNMDWGLADLRLENGIIDGDEVLKPILHALLISGTLPSLSLAGNKKIKSAGWGYLAEFLKKVSD